MNDIERDNYFGDNKRFSNNHLDTDSTSYSNSLSPGSSHSGSENAEPTVVVDCMDTSDYVTINVPKVHSAVFQHSYANVSQVDSLPANIDIGMILCFYLYVFIFYR